VEGWEKKGEGKVSVPRQASVDRGGKREEKYRKGIRVVERGGARGGIQTVAVIQRGRGERKGKYGVDKAFSPLPLTLSVYIYINLPYYPFFPLEMVRPRYFIRVYRRE